jgi:hypothetical protein
LTFHAQPNCILLHASWSAFIARVEGGSIWRDGGRSVHFASYPTLHFCQIFRPPSSTAISFHPYTPHAAQNLLTNMKSHMRRTADWTARRACKVIFKRLQRQKLQESKPLKMLS